MSRHDMSSLTSTPTPNLTSDVVVDVTEISNNVTAAKPSQVQQRAVKFYAVHIGPSKTGTSAIQKDLSCIPFEANTTGEDKDRVIYVGKRDQNGCREGEIRNINGHSISPKQEQRMYVGVTKCLQKILDDYYDQRSRNESERAAIDKHLETDEETRASLRQTIIEKCFNNSFSYILDYSIVDSDEGYSYRSDMEYLARRFRAFDILGYKNIVVGAYRRYADWLVSAYTESIKSPCLWLNLDGVRKTTVCGSLEDFLQTHLDRENRSEYNVRWYKNIHHTIPGIVEAGPSNLEAKNLNYFQLPKVGNNASYIKNHQSTVKKYDSITTELYCDALGMELMPYTCSHSQKVEKVGSDPQQGPSNASDATVSVTAVSHIQNKGTTSDSVYQSIVAAGYRLGFLLLTNEEISANKKPCIESKKHFWCDDINACLRERKDNCTIVGIARREEIHKITAGGKISIVGSNSSNITMWKDLSRYHTGVHKLSWTKSLPVRCPSTESLEKLLNRSLNFEKLVMPEFYASPLGMNEHKRIFWDVWLEEMKLFCWVDIQQLFQNATSWDEIINDRMVKYDRNVTYGATEK